MIRFSYDKIKFSAAYDFWLLLSALTLIVFGLVMVASASVVVSDREFSYPFHYFFRQCFFAVIGFLLSLIVVRLPLRFWRHYSLFFLLLSVLLLLFVLLPGVGHTVNGSRRWISFFGFVALQVSEFAKLCFILYLAAYVSRYAKQIESCFWSFIKPIILLSMVGILLLMEPDFGSLAVLSMSVLGVLFLSGVRLLPFLALLLLACILMFVFIVLAPYRLERLVSFLHPWHHPFGSGYQLTQSLIAFGRGAGWGVGLGNSIQKMFYLPEAYTDFIFAVIAEELGLVGVLLLLILFCILVYRIFLIGRRAHRLGEIHSAFICYGGGLWISLQALINMGVSLGVLPTKGLTLPFISYGGSSLLANCILIGIVSRVSRELGSAQRRSTALNYY